MAGNLETVLRKLVMGALPGLFGGAAPTVQLAVTGDVFDVDPDSLDATAGEPRPDDRTDLFPFDPLHPVGPYTLTQPPYPAPIRLWLMTAAGDRLSLRDQEIVWNKIDNREFTLNLTPTRELSAINGLRVLYGVTSIFTKIKALQKVTVQIKSSNVTNLQQAEALVIAVIQLNRQQIIDQSSALYEDGVYGTSTEIKSLKLVRGEHTADDIRLLNLLVDFELKASRALDETEGRPIVHISTPGRPHNPNHKIDINIDVEA